MEELILALASSWTPLGPSTTMPDSQSPHLASGYLGLVVVVGGGPKLPQNLTP